MQTITLMLPEEQIQTLEHEAGERGKTVDALLSEIIGSTLPVRSEFNVTQDPIFNIRSHASTAPEDLSEHSDHYLYGAVKL